MRTNASEQTDRRRCEWWHNWQSFGEIVIRKSKKRRSPENFENSFNEKKSAEESHGRIRSTRLISASTFLTTLMRPVVSYDDITLPYDSVSAVVQETSRIVAHNNNRTSTTNKSSSSKKRKRKSRHSAAATSGHHGITGNNNNFNGEEDEDAVYLEVEESRELTHDEIWDDSALIEAWNAAAEEYKVKLTLYHERSLKNVSPTGVSRSR